MSLFFRRTLRLGPICLNFSKSGVGVSAGVTGLRVGVDARGRKYLAAGRGGLYYHQTLKDTPASSRDPAATPGTDEQGPTAQGLPRA